ncbi:hypothetical protein [Variovorax sp. Root473]|nr:hypothetical protein [Variovorax sp. Root473]
MDDQERTQTGESAQWCAISQHRDTLSLRACADPLADGLLAAFVTAAYD